MSITDELRKVAAKTECANGRCEKLYRGDLEHIADRIDAEYQKALDEWKAKHGQMWLKGYSECHAELLEGNETLASDLERCGWIRLPKDADGEPIHIGDELRDEWYEQNQGEVEWLMLDHHGWWLMLKNNCERFYVHEFHEWRHHHAPTVEDVLREMLDKWGELPSNMTNEAIVSEYAAKLRLAGGDE